MLFAVIAVLRALHVYGRTNAGVALSGLSAIASLSTHRPCIRQLVDAGVIEGKTSRGFEIMLMRVAVSGLSVSFTIFH